LAKSKGLDQKITHLTQGIPKLRLFGSLDLAEKVVVAMATSLNQKTFQIS